MEAIKEITKGDLRLRIMYDDNPCSPREDDNLGKMVCWHPRYALGDKHDYKTPQDFYASDEYKNRAVILPLRLYDHSGISMSTSTSYPYDDIWDACQVGYIFITKERIVQEYGGAWETHKAKVQEILEGEVGTYDKYLRGHVYGFVLEQIVECKTCKHIEYKHEDSCWGFYELKGIADSVPNEFREEIKAL